MKEKSFNNLIADSQGTAVKPIPPEHFDFERYADYEAARLEKNRDFWQASQAVAVYRRFRVPEVYTYRCHDMKMSLALQLGALHESMKYEADIVNFLEPWYGIGTIAGAFGATYQWEPGQAPAVKPPFSSLQEALDTDIEPVEETPIGRQTLDMIDYFLEKTRGRLPLSLTDTQSPMNTASFLLETNAFYMSFYDDPEGLKQLLERITAELLRFTQKQKDRIGDVLVSPGHGFASSRSFRGLGMSDDVMTTLSDQLYREFEIPYLETVGEPFGGPAFHSCGNWSGKTDTVRQIPRLVMVDGAFSAQTDPDENPSLPFSQTFRDTGIVVNARIVGDSQGVIEKVKKLWSSGMKLIVVTYCQTPREQANVYQQIHQHCEG